MMLLPTRKTKQKKKNITLIPVYKLKLIYPSQINNLNLLLDCLKLRGRPVFVKYKNLKWDS